MANTQNLRPLNTRTQKERKEIARMGAIASNKKQAERKTLREELLLLLQEADNQKNISVAMLKQAMNGSVKAFEVIRDTIGEKPVEEIKHSGSIEEYITKVEDKNEY